MDHFTLWGGHVECNKAGQSAFRGYHESPGYLKEVFGFSIVGWLPNADSNPSRAWGQIRGSDGVTILSTASWDGERWNWTT